MREARGWTLRDGAGGGKRVSAATALRDADPAAAPDLVRIPPGDDALDAALDAQRYAVADPTVLYVAPSGALAGPLPHGTAYWMHDRLAIMEEIWAAGGIGAGRLAVMDRAPEPKTMLLCRAGDRAAAAGFVAAAEGIAMVHAVEVLPEFRRLGAGRLTMRAAATWALRHGAPWLSLAVTEANAPARALYARLGMTEAGRYHYRQKRP
jgi:GNAT superfamily N-acetyltransferase